MSVREGNLILSGFDLNLPFKVPGIVTAAIAAITTVQTTTVARVCGRFLNTADATAATTTICSKYRYGDK